jgi:hypothetical protein
VEAIVEQLGDLLPAPVRIRETVDEQDRRRALGSPLEDVQLSARTVDRPRPGLAPGVLSRISSRAGGLCRLASGAGLHEQSLPNDAE